MGKIREILLRKCGYSEYAAKVTEKDLSHIKGIDLMNARDLWVESDIQSDIVENPYTTKMLVREYGMTYPAALLFIDWYREDPVNASKALVRM